MLGFGYLMSIGIFNNYFGHEPYFQGEVLVPLEFGNTKHFWKKYTEISPGIFSTDAHVCLTCLQ